MSIMMLVDTAVTVPITVSALIDDTDFKTREESVVYNQAGLDLVWNFVTPAGVMTQTAVTPTDTGGDYDWTNVGNGIYKIEIPASGGASINNDTEGYGWFTGFATGILPWTGPIITFAPANVVNSLVVGSDLLDVSMVQVLGTALTEGAAGRLAGGMVKWFNVATPTGTVNSIPDAVAGAANGLFIAGTNAATTVTTSFTTTFTGNLSGSIGSLATQAKADVNAEVVDCLNVDTYAEPGQGAPAATASIVAKLGYAYKAWRNKKTQTATVYSLFADDATTVDQKAAVTDDGTTTTVGEVASGP